MLVYDGWHKIKLITAKLKGREVKRELLMLPSAVGAILIDTTGRVGLVRQYRPTIDRMCWEIPAGVLDKPHLTPLETLIEEIQEECEITPQEILELNETPLCTYYMVTGSSDATMSIYYARVLAQLDRTVSDADVDELKWFTVDELNQLVADGEIIDSKTLISASLIKELVL